GNEHGAIVAGEIIGELQLAVHYSDHGEAHASDLDGFPDGIAPAEKLVLHAIAEEDHAAAFHFVAGIEPAPLDRILVAHFAVFRAHSTGRGVDQAIAKGNG